MKVEYGRPMDRGVSQLMYVGEHSDTLGNEAPPNRTQVAAAVAASVAWVAKTPRVKIAASLVAIALGLKSLRG